MPNIRLMLQWPGGTEEKSLVRSCKINGQSTELEAYD